MATTGVTTVIIVNGKGESMAAGSSIGESFSSREEARIQCAKDFFQKWALMPIENAVGADGLRDAFTNAEFFPRFGLRFVNSNDARKVFDPNEAMVERIDFARAYWYPASERVAGRQVVVIAEIRNRHGAWVKGEGVLTIALGGTVALGGTAAANLFKSERTKAALSALRAHIAPFVLDGLIEHFGVPEVIRLCETEGLLRFSILELAPAQ